MLASVLDSLLFDSLVSTTAEIISMHSGWPYGARRNPGGRWITPVASVVSAPPARPRWRRALQRRWQL